MSAYAPTAARVYRWTGCVQCQKAGAHLVNWISAALCDEMDTAAIGLSSLPRPQRRGSLSALKRWPSSRKRARITSIVKVITRLSRRPFFRDTRLTTDPGPFCFCGAAIPEFTIAKPPLCISVSRAVRGNRIAMLNYRPIGNTVCHLEITNPERVIISLWPTATAAPMII